MNQTLLAVNRANQWSGMPHHPIPKLCQRQFCSHFLWNINEHAMLLALNSPDSVRHCFTLDSYTVIPDNSLERLPYTLSRM